METKSFIDDWMNNNKSLCLSQSQKGSIYNINKQLNVVEQLDEGLIYFDRFVFRSETNNFHDLWELKRLFVGFRMALKYRFDTDGVIKPFMTYSFSKDKLGHRVVLNMVGHKDVMSSPWIDSYLSSKLEETMVNPVYYTREPIAKPSFKINELVRGQIFYDLAKSSLLTEERHLGVIPKYLKTVGSSKMAERFEIKNIVSM